MSCVYCQQVKAGTRHGCPLHPSAEQRAAVEKASQQMARVHQQRREEKERYWAGLGVGDAVVLNVERSAALMRMPDDEGIQIQLDGVIRSLGEVYATVMVDMESVGGCFGVTVQARPKELSQCEGVNRWTRRTARATDRRRKEGSGELDYWAPL